MKSPPTVISREAHGTNRLPGISIEKALGTLAAHEPGESVRVTVVRAAGERKTLTVKLGRVPDTTG